MRRVRVKENYPKIWRELLLAPTADLVPEILQHLRVRLKIQRI